MIVCVKQNIDILNYNKNKIKLLKKRKKENNIRNNEIK